MKNHKILLSFFSLICLILIYPKSAYAISTDRLQGVDRYNTAAKICDAGWQKSNVAIIATGDGFADALCAAPLAKKYNAPIILTDTANLTLVASDELKRLGVNQVFIVGGTGVVSTNTENQIRALGIGNITRLAGADRYETSVKVAQQLNTANGIVIATGNNFPDALSMAPIAALKGMPILLTDTNSIPTIVTQYLNGKGIPKAYVVGGTGVITDNAVRNIPNIERLSGLDRYATNIAILNKFAGDLNFNTMYLATGENFPDALSGSALAALTSSPLLLSSSTLASSSQYFYDMNCLADTNIKFLGGEAVIPSSSIQAVGTSTAVTVNNSDELYAAIKKHIAQGDDTNVIIADSNVISQIGDIAFKVSEDQGYAGYISTVVWVGYGNNYTIRFNYKGGVSTFKNKINAVNSAVQSIITSLIKPGMSDYDKELAIHDYVVNSTKYDYDNYVNGTIPDDSYTAYGALTNNHVAVCEGYGESMYRLLNAAGISNLIAVGTDTSGTGHEWNIVKVSGNYYQVDATWDDPISSSGNILTHDYFNLTDVQMANDHIWDTNRYPKCTATDYAYHTS